MAAFPLEIMVAHIQYPQVEIEKKKFLKSVIFRQTPVS